MSFHKSLQTTAVTNAELVKRLGRVLTILEENLSTKCEHCKKIMEAIHNESLCNRHKTINERGWAVGESNFNVQHKEYHHQLFADPEKRRGIIECPICGFFSLPYEPIFYQDTREGIEWAEWAERKAIPEREYVFENRNHLADFDERTRDENRR